MGLHETEMLLHIKKDNQETTTQCEKIAASNSPGSTGI
jgi:hypothetical protein